MQPDDDPDRCICLLCFGRGGSNIVTNLITSSPDVYPVVIEWHRHAFEKFGPLRKALRRTYGIWSRAPGFAQGLLPRRAISRYWRARSAAALSSWKTPVEPRPGFVNLKVMDYNIDFLPVIRLAYRTAKPVALVRHPLAQVESLMRSGASLEAAIGRYNDVASAMVRMHTAMGVPIVRFEDLLEDPVAFAYRLHDLLGIARCAPDGFGLKRKPFGDARQPGTAVSSKDRIRLDEPGLRAFVAPDVNEKAMARLSPEQTDAILRGTAAVAADLGYGPVAVGRAAE